MCSPDTPPSFPHPSIQVNRSESNYIICRGISSTSCARCRIGDIARYDPIGIDSETSRDMKSFHMCILYICIGCMESEKIGNVLRHGLL